MTSVSIKMNWQASLHLLLVLRDTGDRKGKEFANAELLRMARVADRAVATAPKRRRAAPGTPAEGAQS